MKYVFAVSFLWVTLSSLLAAPSWGAKGHRIIVAVAYHYLSPSAREALRAHLSPMSIGDASIWADKARFELRYTYTASWHYATVPEGMSYNNTLAPKEGDIITAIEAQLQRLSTRKKDKQAFALRMILHLIGDLHQPLHIGNGKDRGGNEVVLRFFGEEVSLHYLWDRAMIDTSSGGINSWVARLRNKLSPQQKLRWMKRKSS